MDLPSKTNSDKKNGTQHLANPKELLLKNMFYMIILSSVSKPLQLLGIPSMWCSPKEELSQDTPKMKKKREEQKGKAFALRPQHLFPKSSQNDLKHESDHIPLFKTVYPHNGLQSPT